MATMNLKSSTMIRAKNETKKWIIAIVRAFFLVGICFVVLYPIILDMSFAFKPVRDYYDPSVIFIPKHFTLETIKNCLTVLNYGESFVNSFLLSSVSGIFQVISCACVGYGFGRFNFPLKKLWFGLVIFTLMIPAPIILSPLYIQFNSYNPLSFLGVKGGLHLIDTIAPITLMSAFCMMFRNGVFIYMFRQFFRGVPKELDEAAMLDGANRFEIFYKIALVNARTIIITIFLFAFVWQWTDVTYTTAFMPMTNLVANTGSNVYAKVQAMYGRTYETDPVVQLMYIKSSSLLCMVPLLVLYVFLQSFFTESIERSGVVG